ncbi:MAG: type II secretion system protein, partial [Haloferacaceae archaeon]
ARRTRAVGETTDLVGRAALRMRVEPTAERAAAFAADAGSGPLAASLADHVGRARGTPGTGLRTFAAEWVEWFPALERAVTLVEAAGREPPEERETTLDRALDAVLDGTRDRLAAFATEVRGPLTGLYAFGVLLPLALVGTVPAARVAGVRVSVGAIVVAYDLLLPLALLAASVRLLVRRPVAFPPPRVDRSHPDVPDRRWPALGLGLGAGTASWVAATELVAGWAGPVAAAGVAPGVALLVHYRPVKRVRDRTRAAESNLDDALHLVGRRVADGEAVESALADAAATLDGETGSVLADAVGVRRRLGTTVAASFLGEHGALAAVPSPRLRSAAALFDLAARDGAPAGEAILAMADQLDGLRRVEREGRRELSRVTDTLANTAAVFGPLVGGATVALAANVARTGSGPLGRGGLPADALGPAVGAYVLLLAAVLTGLSTGLERGLDRPLLGYRVGAVLPTATATYLAAVAAAGLVF